MRYKKSLLSIALVSIWTIPGFAQSDLATSSQELSRAGSVQNDVEAHIAQQVSEQRKNIINEAVTAIDDTYHAINALAANKPNEALTALQDATGKLSIILAREPNLAFAPVNVSVTIYDLYATPQTVKAVINEAQSAIKDGNIPKARKLVSGLASEAVINVTSLPLATYPDAIKATIPLIDQGRLQEAKAQLVTILNTLVVTQHIFPLPFIRTFALVKRLELLSQTVNRSSEQDEEITNIIVAIRNQIEMARVLGYADKQNYKLLNKQIDSIEKRIKENKTAAEDLNNMEQTLNGIMKTQPL